MDKTKSVLIRNLTEEDNRMLQGIKKRQATGNPRRPCCKRDMLISGFWKQVDRKRRK